MGIPLFFIFFIIFLIVFQFKLRKNNSLIKKNNNKFWQQEEQSLFIRKKPLKFLEYITLNVNLLPLITKNDCQTSEDNEIFTIQQRVIETSKLPMLNFMGKTNTELKLAYGPANLDTLTLYENNYTTLIRDLYNWATLLYQNNQFDEALQVSECSINIGTDISDHYILLGNLYLKNHDDESFQSLLKLINNTQSLLKNKILTTLHKLEKDYNNIN